MHVYHHDGRGDFECCRPCPPFPCPPPCPPCLCPVIGPTGPTGGPGSTAIYLATDQLVSDGGWGGLGTSSSPSLFTSSTVTLSAETNLTAEIFTSPCGFTDPVGTGITATITGSSNAETPNYLAIGTGSVGVTQDSLLSVRLTTSQGVGF